MPPTSVATTGSPAAMYSRIAFGSPSLRRQATDRHPRQVIGDVSALARKENLLSYAQFRRQPVQIPSQLPPPDQQEDRIRHLRRDDSRCLQKQRQILYWTKIRHDTDHLRVPRYS